jgi:F-type H+-transporting ATPase subunit epsilon
MSFRLAIHTPQEVVFEDTIDSLVAPGSGGLYGVLAQHAPMVGTVVTGVLKVTRGSQKDLFLIGNGVADVTPERVEIFADMAVRLAVGENADTRLADYLKERALPAVVAPESFRDG